MTARIVAVTGTGTGVGKTVTIAALAAGLRTHCSVAVVKPVQTGVGPEWPDEVADVDVVAALAGCETHELARLPDPLAPETAARLRGTCLPSVAEHAATVARIAAHHDMVLVEGAGGLLVRLDGDGGTLLDLVLLLDAEVLVVTSPALGTLNQTELTVAAMRHRGVEPVGLLIGSWPADPGLAERCNLSDLPTHTGVPVLGAVPEGSGRMVPAEFRASASRWVDAALTALRRGP